MLTDLESYGGAAIAASRLAIGLAERAIVIRTVGFPDGDPHPWHTISLRQSHYLLGFGRRISAPLTFASSKYWAKQQLSRLLKKLRPDVINVHNLHSAQTYGWSIDMVGICSESAPTIWTLHDMFSFTGGCAYSFDCERWKTGCDEGCTCPAGYPKPLPHHLAEAWEARRRLIGGSIADLVAVTPSRWLANLASEGLWRGADPVCIPYGVPLQTFRPIDRLESRRALGIPERGPVILSAAISLLEARKGGRLLLEAIRRLPDRPMTLITLGADALEVNSAEGNSVLVKNMGHIADERRLAVAYSAADILVHPAVEDNLPNVLLESIACGTPILAFDRGGMPDVVRPGATGWLVKRVSAEALAVGLREAIGEVEHGQTLRRSCRAIAEREYSVELQSKRYLDLFSHCLLKRSQSTPS